MANFIESVRPRLRSAQSAALAVAFGSLLLVAIAVLLPEHRPDSLGTPILSGIAFVAFAVLGGLALTLPRCQTRTALAQLAKEHEPPAETARLLFRIHQTALIYRTAPLAIAAPVAGIAYIVDAQPWVLAIPLVSMAMMGLSVPTQMQLARWLHVQTRRLQELRQEVSL